MFVYILETGIRYDCRTIYGVYSKEAGENKLYELFEIRKVLEEKECTYLDEHLDVENLYWDNNYLSGYVGSHHFSLTRFELQE
jgi:hypothetical protein